MTRTREATRRPDDLVVFLGPSLPVAEARALAPCRVLPPARQGDVWRALALNPRAIVLVDGVFEATPSVWHREILAALDAGVAVFGASSMGALRAAELWRHGMVGVGRIFAWYRDGLVVDDAEVALVHAGPEHGHRPFTVPLVNVRHAAHRALAEGILARDEAVALVRAAEAVSYRDRTWAGLLGAVGRRWGARARGRWAAWAAAGVEDLKSLDARQCLREAACFVKAHRGARGLPVEPVAVPSLARRRRLREGASGSVRSGEVLAALLERPDGAALADDGVRRLLIAGWAREHGLQAKAGDVDRARRRWLERVGASTKGQAISVSGLDAAEARRLWEDEALERLALRSCARLLSDGPSRDEGLAVSARASGLWARTARRRS